MEERERSKRRSKEKVIGLNEGQKQATQFDEREMQGREEILREVWKFFAIQFRIEDSRICSELFTMKDYMIDSFPQEQSGETVMFTL